MIISKKTILFKIILTCILIKTGKEILNNLHKLVHSKKIMIKNDKSSIRCHQNSQDLLC